MQVEGSAFLLPNVIAILSRYYGPGRRQNMIFCLFGATAPLGFHLGAVFASILAQLSGFIIPATSRPSNSEQEGSSIWQRADGFGSITGVATLILFNFAWNQDPIVR